MSCAKFFSSYKSHTRHDRSIERQTAAAPAAPAQAESGRAAERKDLLPWPIKTRKRGSISNPALGKEVGISISTWDLPPKKRILMSVQATRVDRFTCVVCGRVFEDYHGAEERCWGGSGGHRRHFKVVPAFDVNRDQLPRFDRDEATSQDLPWYGIV